MNNYKIGIIDSGLGGTSILKELINIMPNEEYIYISDSINAPYGSRPLKEIYNLSSKMVKKLLKYNVKTIVIACNTITTSSIAYLKEKFKNVHFIGTTPYIEGVLKDSPMLNSKKILINKNNKKISIENKKTKVLIISTKVTKNSKYVKNMVKSLKPFLDIKTMAMGKLVKYIENLDFDSKELENYINKSFEKYLDIDYLVLGCTHFPFLTKNFKKVKFKKDIKIIDGAKNIALTTKNFIEENGLSNNSKLNIKIVDTINKPERHYTFAKFLNVNVNNIEFI